MTQILTVYRGVRADADTIERICAEPFAGCRRSLPTFTPYKSIALQYGETDNDGGQNGHAPEGMIGSYALSLHNPATLTGRSSFYSVAELAQLLGDELAIVLRESEVFLHGDWQASEPGTEETQYGRLADIRKLYPDTWMQARNEGHEIMDCPVVIEALRRCGYDSVVYEGAQMGIEEDIAQLASLEAPEVPCIETDAVEYRVFNPSQIAFLGAVPAHTFRRTLEEALGQSPAPQTTASPGVGLS